MPKILLIEDNKNNADIMKRVLVRNGHEVFHAAEGLVGLEIATSEQVDIVLVDLGLPDVSGATMVSLIKRLPNDIPTVVVTASFNQADWRKVVNRGIIGYMTKPINTRTFAVEVEKFLAQARQAARDNAESKAKEEQAQETETQSKMSMVF